MARPASNGFTPLARSAGNGFTLVELLVALFIFALLASAAVALLSFAVRAQASSFASLEQVSKERRLSAILIADLAQALPRVSRDGSGGDRPAFQAERGELQLAFVRGGGNPRFVEIRLKAGRLTRAEASFADGAAAAPEMVLAESVERAELRFRAKAEWEDVWSPARTDSLPRAVELTLFRKDKPAVTRMFLVGAGQ